MNAIDTQIVQPRPEVNPYPLPRDLAPRLNAVRAYWEHLKRGNADIPFTDDLKLSQLGGAANYAFVLAVFERPERFRFDVVGKEVEDRCGAELSGRFLGELEDRVPFDGLLSQCAATMRSRIPTFFRHFRSDDAYRRLLLPLWADGHISALLGAID